MRKVPIQYQLSRFTGNYSGLNKKAMTMKKSWNEVDKLLQSVGKKKENTTNNSKKS